MARCWFCSKVKGKRICPARGGELICSRCCGSQRRVAIRCPESCPYLHGTHDPRWVPESQEKEAARFYGRALSLEEKPAQFYLFLHYLIATRANPLRSLSDRDFQDVVETAVKTIETRAKGVLYTHAAASAHLQGMADWLVRLVSMRSQIEKAPDVSDAEALDALRAVAAAVGEGAESSSGRERYLDSVARLVAGNPSELSPLELPEELDGPPRGLIVAP